MEKRISSAVIHRMPRYYRHLCDLQDAGIVRISSGALADRMGLTASQVRQDFNCFGGFGQQGYGYNVAELRAAIAATGYSCTRVTTAPYEKKGLFGRK